MIGIVSSGNLTKYIHALGFVNFFKLRQLLALLTICIVNVNEHVCCIYMTVSIIISCLQSLGCVLYQMCALVPPFDSPSLIQLLFKIIKGKYDVSILLIMILQIWKLWYLYLKSRQFHNINKFTVGANLFYFQPIPEQYSQCLHCLVAMILVTSPDKRPR